ncbi:MAG: hypothetical protein JWR21_1804 [Herminiimonas sp.]|nr:hypothetical protein [Herminiimonas sp.]
MPNTGLCPEIIRSHGKAPAGSKKVLAVSKASEDSDDTTWPTIESPRTARRGQGIERLDPWQKHASFIVNYDNRMAFDLLTKPFKYAAISAFDDALVFCNWEKRLLLLRPRWPFYVDRHDAAQANSDGSKRHLVARRPGIEDIFMVVPVDKQLGAQRACEIVDRCVAVLMRRGGLVAHQDVC